MNKQDEIKNAALTLFAVKGYSATSMQEIADTVGLNKASLYFYTKGKKELYLLIVEEQLSLLKTEVEDIFNAYINEPIDVMLFQAFKAIVFKPSIEGVLLWKRMQIKVASNVVEELGEPLREIILSNNKSIRSFVNAFICEKKLMLDEAVIARFVIAYETFIQGVLDWRLLNINADFDEMELIWNHFWNGSRLV